MFVNCLDMLTTCYIDNEAEYSLINDVENLLQTFKI